jgi:NitT/TauT family transport system permease protein
LLPYAIAANAIPIIAFAPIFNNWFGLVSPIPKVAIAAVLVFFPVMINMLRGLTSVHPSSIELMRSYAAGEAATFRRVRIPNSFPFLFSGLKVASVLAMIGAVVSQYFGGLRTTSLGLFIKEKAALALFPEAWAAIVLASVLGVAFYLAIVLVERSVLRWHPSVRGAQAG